MPLSLKIISFKGLAYPQGEDVLFEDTGGTIGRSDANVLILTDDDKIISRRHAAISLDDGQYRLVDSSLAGTYIADAVEPINNSSVQLLDGMQFRIGEYSIAVTISEQSSPFSASWEDDPVDSDNSPFEDTGSSSQAGADSLDLVNPNDLLGMQEDEFSNPLLTNSEIPSDFAEEFLSSGEPDSDIGLLNVSEQNNLLDQSFSGDDNRGVEGDNQLLESPDPSPENSQHGLGNENISSLNDSFVPPEIIKNSVGSEVPGEMPEDFNFEDLFNHHDEGSSDKNEINSESVSENISQTDNLLKPTSVSQVNDSKVAPEQQQPLTPAVATTPKVVGQAKTISNDQLMQAFLSGAEISAQGIDLSNLDEKMSRIGSMFRQFAESTVAVLRSRAEFKSLFRVSVTTIKTTNNNPLKFAVTTDEAIKHLINDGQDGFKPSIESIDEGFNDLLNHQLAMQAGIQGSLNEIFRKFDPAVIEKKFAEGLVLQKKSKCWDRYNQIHAQLKETAIDDFFGEAFSEAYENQMKQLKK